MIISRNLYIKYNHVLYLLFLILLLNSCESKPDSIDPQDYEKYISISADKYPVISPDADYIAFYHECLEYPESTSYPTGLYIMDIDGINRRLLIRGRHWSPSWSPDGHWLVFTSDGVLQITNFNSDSIRTFSGIKDLPLFSPNWSKDGKEVLFSAPLTIEGGVFKITPDFTSLKRVFDPLINNGMYASWSPDRSKILYQKGNKELPSVEIFIIDTLLITEQRLTFDTEDDKDASWSPNGEQITWSSSIRIMIMNSDGSNKKKLDYGRYPSWSPSSDFIIYSNANFDFTKEVLYKINKDGTDRIQLTY